MPIIVSPAESDILTALRAFVLSVVPSGIDCIDTQQNRVPEPQSGSFITMTPLRRVRLATNIHIYADCSFTASLVGSTLTVSALGTNNEIPITIGAAVTGPGVPLVVIQQQVSGTPGGVGVYTVSPSSYTASGTFAAGQATVTEMVEITHQLQFHSADNTSADMAQAVHMMLRDPYAVQLMQALNPAIVPLYGSEPRQAPYIDAEDQFEFHWVVESVLQANVTLSGLNQDFVTTLDLTLVPVDVVFPPEVSPSLATEAGSLIVTEDGLTIAVTT